MMVSQYHNTRRKFNRLAKALIRLRVCAGWSESSLVAHITLLEISCRGSFQRRDDAHGSLRLAQDVIRYKNCGVTSWGSRSRLPERAITTVQAPGDRKNPSVLWLKYDFNINKTGILAIHFYFCIFFNVNDVHGIFFNSRIRFLFRSRLVPRIDSV